MKFEPNKIITSPNIESNFGSFGLDKSPFKFETCREVFAFKFGPSSKGFFLKHTEKKGEEIATFMEKTELILKIRKRSKFSLTNHDTILWIEPCWFWRKCRCHRSLLTILVRAAMLYDIKEDNYEKTLFSHKYVIPTKNAVQRFLYGFTKYVGPDLGGSNMETNGWRAIFEDKTKSDIKKMLISPRTRNYSPQADLADDLWV